MGWTNRKYIQKRQCRDIMTIKELDGTHLDDYLTALCSLYTIDIRGDKAADVFRKRLKYSRTFVAIIDNKVAGAISILLEHKYGHDAKLVAHIEDVVVNDNCRSKGIGLALVRYAIETARMCNCYKVVLNCKESLVPFYEKAGLYNSTVGMRIDL